MERIVLKARAKINWTLDVIGKRPDGYHEIETVMQSVDLWDKVILEKRGEGIHLQLDTHKLPQDSRNIAWKAAALVKERFDIDGGVMINIDKNIPIAAGLGGGSADGAAVLVGLNFLWDLKMSEEEIRIMAKALGADVPFCIRGGSALAKGIGEKLTIFEPACPVWLVIVKPSIGVSTAEIFDLWDTWSVPPVKRPRAERMVDALLKRDVRGIADAMDNVLEVVTASIHPEILDIKQRLIDLGAVKSLMSGSGPSVYGIFEDKLKAQRAGEHFKWDGAKVFVTCTSNKGTELMEES